MAAVERQTSGVVPVFKDPGWLTQINLARAERDPLPLEIILTNSLYYPGSGMDGDPIKYLSTSTNSFVYSDYWVTHSRWENELRRKCFRGYSLKLRRRLDSAEVAPNGFSRPCLLPEDDHFSHGEFCAGGSDCLRFEWLIYERDHHSSPARGPQRLSLLFLGVDGLAAFHTLYVEGCRAAPAVVAVIQAPMGYGKNWTDFERPSGPLARSVMANPAGAPLALFYGGQDFGKPALRQRFLAAPCWPHYSRFLNSFSKHDGGAIGLWTLPRLAESLPTPSSS